MKNLIVLVLLGLLVGCIETASEPETTSAYEQCHAVLGAFCTHASVCDPVQEQTCWDLVDTACERNRTVLSQTAFALCELDMTQTTCDGTDAQLTSGARACLTIFTSWE